MDGNSINWLDKKELDLLQSFQDETAHKNNLYIQLLRPNFSPIINNSFPNNTISADKEILSEFLFTTEGNLSTFSTYISEPLYLTYLTGKIIRSFFPVRVNQNIIAYVDVLKFCNQYSINQLLSQIAPLLNQPGLKSSLEYYLDNYAIIPPTDFFDKVDKIGKNVTAMVDEWWQKSNQPGQNNGTNFANFPETINSLVFYTNLNGQIIYTTKPLCKLLGYHEFADIKGKSIYSILKVKILETITDSYENFPLKEISLQQVELIHTNGTTLYANLQISSYFPENCQSTPTMLQWHIDPAGPVLFSETEKPHALVDVPELFPQPGDTVYDSLTDLSETETVAEPDKTKSGPRFFLTQSLKGFASVLDAYPRPLIILDQSNCTILWNNRAEQLFHLKPDIENEFNFNELLTLESKTIWDKELKSFRENNSKDLVIDRFIKCKSVNGSPISAKFNLFKNDLLGSEFISLTVQEIEIPIPGNEYLLAQASKTTSGILLTDNGGEIFSANNDALLFLKMEKTELERTNISDLFERKDRHRLNNILLKLYIKNSFETTACLLEKYEVDGPIHIHINKLYDNEDQKYNLIWMFNSIENGTNSAKTVKSISPPKTLGPPNESLSDIYRTFAGLFEKISFQIFETLAELREELYASPEQKSLLLKIENIAEQASKISEKLKIFKYKGHPTFKPLNVNLLLEDLLNILRTEFHHPIILDAKKSTPILADQEDMWFIFHSLLENADEAISEKGKITIRTFLKTAQSTDPLFDPSDYDSTFVACQILDNGKGIPKNIHEKLFTLFATNKIDRIGRGMSLACVRAIVNRYHGYIDVKTTPGQGTSVTVYFPTLPKKTSKEKKETRLDPTLATILAVDDDTLILEMYSSNLEKEYNVLCAENGEEAIKIMEDYKDDIRLVILDINLPDSKMIDCPITLHNIKPAIPFIVATGYSNDGTLDELLKKVRAFWLHKPFPIQKLKIAIEKLLNVY